MGRQGVIHIENVAALRELVGQQLGVSDWTVVSQERINAFADATEDHQWIHVDTARARAELPSGTTIAHGFLTLSLVSRMLRNVVSVGSVRMSINYGLNRVRFISPVPSGSRIRGRVVLGSLTHEGEALQATWQITVERDGGERPVMAAEWIVRYYPA